jgi:hypothetical protein
VAVAPKVTSTVHEGPLGVSIVEQGLQVMSGSMREQLSRPQ